RVAPGVGAVVGLAGAVAAGVDDVVRVGAQRVQDRLGLLVGLLGGVVVGHVHREAADLVDPGVGQRVGDLSVVGGPAVVARVQVHPGVGGLGRELVDGVGQQPLPGRHVHVAVAGDHLR